MIIEDFAKDKMVVVGLCNPEWTIFIILPKTSPRSILVIIALISMLFFTILRGVIFVFLRADRCTYSYAKNGVSLVARAFAL